MMNMGIFSFNNNNNINNNNNNNNDNMSEISSSTTPAPTSSLIQSPTTESMQPVQSTSHIIDHTVIRGILDQAFHVKTDEQGRIIPSRRQLGYELFVTRFEPGILIDVFVALIEEFPVVAAECPQYNSWWTPKCHHLIFLVAQAFMSVLIPERVNRKVKERDRRQDPFPKVRVNVTDEQRCRILHAVVPLNFNFDSNFWSLADYVLNLSKCPKDVVTTVLDAARKGQASFTAVDYCIRNKVLSRYIDDPTILYTAALLGPLRATSVESFAAKRTKEFRQGCREALLRVEKLTNSSEEWGHAIVEYLGSIKRHGVNGRVVPYAFKGFHNSVSNLMKDLKGVPPADDRIDIAWAHHLVKRSAEKYYHDKTWKIENLYEVIWTILAQRPFMRKFVVNTLSDDFNDQQSAEMWRTCNIPPNSRKLVKFEEAAGSCSEEEHLDPRTPNPPFLSIPESVQSIEFVRNASDLKRVENVLEDYANDSYPPVGVDAEWSSYVSHSKATILQLAIPSHIFIIDIDAIQCTVLAKFFEKFFVEWKLLKIGYRFDEDLIQLRSAVQKCSALYHPKNLICIGRIVAMLMRESAKRPEVNLDGVFCPEEEPTNEELAEETENVMPTQVNESEKSLETRMNDAADAIPPIMSRSDVSVTAAATEIDEDITASEEEQRKQTTPNVKQNPLLKEIKGLSALCERVLGKPLDKAEQCSVWDRRPLRDLQLRYAALDAYCMLMLYEKCADWASRLDLNINEICSKQEPLIGALPLFYDEQ